MVDGIVYSTAGTRRAVVALDGRTGELLWMHSEQEGARGAAAPRQLSGRGLSYWTDGREERILYVTPGYRLVALDAATGRLVRSFGTDGIVDLKADFDQQVDLVNARRGPARHADHRERRRHRRRGVRDRREPEEPREREGLRARLRRAHAASGCGPSTRSRGRASSATTPGRRTRGPTPATPACGRQISVDPAARPGLPARWSCRRTTTTAASARATTCSRESLVAVDLKTGARKWHYQLVHHGMWDMDIPCAPILADIIVERPRCARALAQPTKQAFLYVFDRETGKPIWPIEERPVPQGDVPGEWYSPTQPFPTKPPAYDGQGFVDRRPDRLHARAARRGRSS